MKINKWFNVSVLGGAALAVAGSAADDAEAIQSGAGDATGQGGAVGGGPDVGGGGAGVGGVVDGCSLLLNSEDPCGCPCCWGDVPNTEASCPGVCSSGNNDAG